MLHMDILHNVIIPKQDLFGIHHCNCFPLELRCSYLSWAISQAREVHKENKYIINLINYKWYN